VTPQSLISKAVRLRAETKQPLSYGELVGENLDDETVMNLHLLLDEWQTALNAVVRAVGDEVVKRLDARGRPMEVSGYLLTTKTGYTRERCVDQAGFFSWLLENPSQGLAAVNPNSLRFGSLPPAVRDTFFEKENVVKPDVQPKPAAIPVEVIEQNRQRKELQ
jgi:hypothetical protein